jgi:hypothetical protein
MNARLGRFQTLGENVGSRGRNSNSHRFGLEQTCAPAYDAWAVPTLFSTVDVLFVYIGKPALPSAYLNEIRMLTHKSFLVTIAAFAVMSVATLASGQILDKQKQLDKQTFWDNQDWEWYKTNIPFFECPDEELNTTYYYRWELLTKHLTYGSANAGYLFTEFIDRPFWSGVYGAISCPAGHQLYEARWLRDPRVATDYAKYWFRTPGAQPRNYSTWIADSVWAIHLAYHDPELATDLLDDLIKNFEAWESRQYVPEVGMFWQNGHDDGMEFNINSRQTPDILRGGNGYRPSFNSYLWADAKAIEQIARLKGDNETADKYRDKADALKQLVQTKLWDPKRSFFFPMSMNDEEREGEIVKALTLTYQSGKYAGNPHGRELIGYVPWQFNLPDHDKGFESAWQFLMDPDYFKAAYGPTSVEKQDPQFLLKNSCCWWSGQSWPYATTQTLKALANLLQNYDQAVITKNDYQVLLETYSLSHRKEGKPYLAEALHPETGSFEGHDAYNHSEHYFHSGFCDLVITGLIGLKPRPDSTIEIHPLANEAWDYFALDDLNYHGHQVSILWDRDGTRYGKGAGLQIIVDGQSIARSDELRPLAAKLPTKARVAKTSPTTLVNFAVNNDGDYFPRVETSHVGEGTSPSKLIDGNYWYHAHPPNRWSAEGSHLEADSVTIDLGTPRSIHTCKLYFLDDANDLTVPYGYQLEYWTGDHWVEVPAQQRTPEKPQARRANVIRFNPMDLSKVRLTIKHQAGKTSGLSEVELWGDATLPIEPAPAPAGNLAFNRGSMPYPKITASHTSRFDSLATVNDGRIVFTPTPANRWTSYESTTATDWLQVEFQTPLTVGRAVLHVYDDGGGVQAPTEIKLQYRVNDGWKDVAVKRLSPEKPTGSVANTVFFEPVRAKQMRVLFVHKGAARSGLTELELWEK